MIRYFEFRHWKSFVESRLEIEPLTILIGSNASGKSNALDGIEFLHRCAQGRDFSTILNGDASEAAIRGGADWASFFAGDDFTLGCLVSGLGPRVDYYYEISVQIRPRIQLKSEKLVRRTYRPGSTQHFSSINLYSTDDALEDSPSITCRLYNGKSGTRRDLRRSASLLGQLELAPQREEISQGVQAVSAALQDLFKLDPAPSRMREYSKLSDELNADASNLAGVIAALPDDERGLVERRLSGLCSQLPERDVVKVFAERIGKFKSDAMLYSQEEWGDKLGILEMDARGMSDGTLRFLAIITALLTRPRNSLVVVEEIDNGLFPARAQLLLSVIREIGGERSVDVLMTTHNAVLLDKIPRTILRTVAVAHRDAASGASVLLRLEDLDALPRLLAAGGLGVATASGDLEEIVEEAA